jgi:hypothetical protein
MRNHSWSTQLIGSWLILIGWRPADGIALKLSGRVILMCGCLLVAAVGPVTVVRGEIITIGANVVNPQRLSAADREALLDQLQTAGVRVIRAPLAPPWRGDDYGPAIDFIRHAYERGISADLIVGLEYRQDAQRRPAVEELPKMWPSYPLSAADPLRFRAVFEPLFEELESMGVVFAALELGNEINWTAFNGDFPIPGEGRIFGANDLLADPEARQIAEGFRAYLQSLAVLKDIRDHSRLNRATLLISAGLSDPGPAGPRPEPKTDAVTISATLEYLRAHGLDALVDVYGVHTYPRPTSSAVARIDQLATDTFADCRPSAQGKPCWLTEWGFPADSPSSCVGIGNDAFRAALITEMLADFRRYQQQGRLAGIMYYAWADDKYGIYRCGRLSESGRLAIDPAGFR